MGIWNGIKRASKAIAEGTGPTQYIAGGKILHCQHCDETHFLEGSAQLNTAGMTFLNMDWANKSATTLMCDNCSLIHWFGERPEHCGP